MLNQSFAAVGAYRTMGGAYTTGEVNFTAGGRPLRVRSISVDARLLNTLGDSWHTVIGVAKDVKQGGVEKQTGTEPHVSLDQLAMAAPTMNVVLRTILPPAALSRTLERLVREVDPAVPIVRLRDMESVFAESIRRPRLLAQPDPQARLG